MDIDQTQRSDIKSLQSNTISLRVKDELDKAPYSLLNYYLADASVTSENWTVNGYNFSKQMIANSDTLIFNVDPIDDLVLKNIGLGEVVGDEFKGLKIKFDLVVSNPTSNVPTLESVGFENVFKLYDVPLNTRSGVCVEVPLDGFSQGVVNSLFCEHGFCVVLNFNGASSNASVSINDLRLEVDYSSMVYAESEIIKDRHNHNDIYSNINHNHDDTYSALNHNHDDTYSALNHNHDDRYYTETEIDSHNQFVMIYNGTYAKAFANKYYVYIYLTGSHTFTTDWVSVWANEIENKYRPMSPIFFKAVNGVSSNQYWAKISSDGKVYLRGSTSTTADLYGGVMYPRKDILP